jgi:protease I
MRGRMSLSGVPSVSSVRAVAVFLSLSLVASVCLAESPRQPSPASPKQPAPPGLSRRVPAGTRLKTIQLPEPTVGGTMSLEQALAGLGKTELPGSERLEFTKIGQLAWAALGARTSPSAENTNSMPLPAELTALKVYLVLPDGLYLYDPVMHALQQTAQGDARESLTLALLKQPGMTGGCQIVLAGSVRDLAARYGTRARTVLLMQAGRVSQNIQLEAVSLGLAVVSVDSVDVDSVRRVIRLSRNLEPLYVAFVGYPAGQAPQTAVSATPAAQTAKAALMIVPPSSFQDEELVGTRRALELAGVQVVVASSRQGSLPGMLGGTIQADLLLNQANVDNFNAVIFIGGLGAVEYFNSPVAQNLARQAFARHKVLAAIGTAPTILANAGVLRGARVTAYISEQQRLTLGGATYTGNPVEKDGLTVTATGALAVVPFAKAILEGLGESR